MNSTKSLDPQALPQPELHGYLLSAVAPRPIAFASTIDREGKVNLSPFSFFNVFSSNPPVMIFSPSRSGRDLTHKHSYLNVQEVPEVVINIVNYPIVEQMSLASTAYEKGVNEFVKAGLTQVAWEKVRPPRVAESPVAFECMVDDVIELGQGGGAGNLIICRVVLIHVQTQYLDASGVLDTRRLDLVGRMGGNWYTRASGDALFEIPKPLQKRGIGIDQLPESIRNSPVLTGNNLGRLGNAEALPDAASVAAMRAEPQVASVLETHKTAPEACLTSLHRLAQQFIEQGNTLDALRILLVAEGV